MSHPSAEQRADHSRDLRKHEPSPRHQKRAVVELAGFCWSLIMTGDLSPEIATQLLRRVHNVCTEFEMDKPPAPDTRVLAAFDGVVPR